MLKKKLTRIKIHDSIVFPIIKYNQLKKVKEGNILFRIAANIHTHRGTN